MPAGSKPGERRGGRKKGTPNKRTILFQEATQRMTIEGVDPIAILCDGARGKIKDPLRIRCASELAKYAYATRKAVEVSGPGGGAIPIDHSETAKQRVSSILDKLATDAETEVSSEPN